MTKHQMTLLCAAAFAAVVILALVASDQNSLLRILGEADASGRPPDKGAFLPNKKIDDSRQLLTKRTRPKDGWLLEDLAKKSYNRDRFATFLPNGKISPQAIQAADLSESEALAIQKIINEQRGELESIIRERMQSVNPERPDEMATYQIGAFEKAGADTFLESIQKIENIIGELRCELLMSGYNPSDSYFSFGRYDTTVSLLRSHGTEQGQPNGSSSVRVVTIDPKTHKKHREQLVPLDEFEVSFGKILPLD